MTKLKNDYLSNRFKEMMVKYNLMEYRKKIRKGEGVSITPIVSYVTLKKIQMLNFFVKII